MSSVEEIELWISSFFVDFAPHLKNPRHWLPEFQMLTINTLICHRDLERASICLRSFFVACENQVKFRFFSDGSITQEDATFLLEEFPDSTLVERSEMREIVAAFLKDHPLCRQFSDSLATAFKIIEMPLYCQHHLGEERFVYIDTDIMFFQVISNWREIWERNIFLFESRVFLSGRPSLIMKKAPVLADLNSGLISFDMRFHDLNFIEWFLGEAVMTAEHHFLSEQTGWALLGAHAQDKGAVFWQCQPDQIVSHIVFEAPKQNQIAVHFIGGHKVHIEEMTPLALHNQNTENKSSQTLNFIPAKRITRMAALSASALNRSRSYFSQVREKLLKQ